MEVYKIMRKKEDKKTAGLSLAVTSKQKEEFKNAANRRNMSLNSYLTNLAEMDIRNECKNDSGDISVRKVGVIQNFINDVCKTVCVNDETKNVMDEKVGKLWELLK